MSDETKVDVRAVIELSAIDDIKAVPLEAMLQAYDLYLNSSASVEDIAAGTGIKRAILAKLIRTRGWATKKRELEREVMVEAENKYREFIIKHKLPTVQRHLDAAERLERAVASLSARMEAESARMEGMAEVDPRELKALAGTLKTLAEALNSASAVSGRSVGLAEKIVDSAYLEHDAKPSVVINNVVPRPVAPVETARIVEVKYAGEEGGEGGNSSGHVLGSGGDGGGAGLDSRYTGGPGPV